MRKQRKVSARMGFTLYFLGVKESHFVYIPVKETLLIRELKPTLNDLIDNAVI